MIPIDLNNKLSQNCLDCLYRTLEPDPKKRITSIELLNHPFVTNENTLSTNSNSSNKYYIYLKFLRPKA